MAMQFDWNEETWAPALADEPSPPWEVSSNTLFITANSFIGVVRNARNYNSRVFSFRWGNCGTVVDAYVLSMLNYGGTVKWSSPIGTFNLAPLPESYNAVHSGWGLTQVSVIMEET